MIKRGSASLCAGVESFLGIVFDITGRRFLSSAFPFFIFQTYLPFRSPQNVLTKRRNNHNNAPGPTRNAITIALPRPIPLQKPISISIDPEIIQRQFSNYSREQIDLMQARMDYMKEKLEKAEKRLAGLVVL